MIRLFISILITGMLFGCTERGERLSADDIAVLTSKHLKLEWDGYGFSGTARILADGKAHLLVSRLGEDTGRWWQEDDQICSKWQRVRDGETLCAYLGALGDEQYELRSIRQDIQWGTFRIVDQQTPDKSD